MSPYVLVHALEKPSWRTGPGGWIGRLYRNRCHDRHELAGQHSCVVCLLSGGWIGLDLAGNLGSGLGQEGRHWWRRLERDLSNWWALAPLHVCLAKSRLIYLESE